MQHESTENQTDAYISIRRTRSYCTFASRNCHCTLSKINSKDPVRKERVVKMKNTKRLEFDKNPAQIMENNKETDKITQGVFGRPKCFCEVEK